MKGFGFWGVPGTCRVTRVHIARDEHSAICGQTFGPRFEYQFCGVGLNDYTLRRIECDACKRRWLAHLRAVARMPKRSRQVLCRLGEKHE